MSAESAGRAGPARPDGGNRIRWGPQEGALPMKRVETGSVIGGIVALILGAGWMALMAGSMLDAIHEQALPGKVVMLAVFASPGLVTAVYGLGQFAYRRETVISRDHIEVKVVGLRGRQSWREPVASYRGVLKRTRLDMPAEEEARIASSYEFTLSLAHDYRRKEILLYESSNRLPVPPADLEAKWRRYAELLRLPRLEAGLTE